MKKKMKAKCTDPEILRTKYFQTENNDYSLMLEFL